MGRRAVGPSVVLDSSMAFLERGAMSKNPLGKVEHTDKGFEIIKFPDMCNLLSHIQASAYTKPNGPGTSAVWIGAVEDGAILLDRQKVKDLILRLGRWLDTGSFEL
jgi:hypothetical protein